MSTLKSTDKIPWITHLTANDRGVNVHAKSGSEFKESTHSDSFTVNDNILDLSGHKGVGKGGKKPKSVKDLPTTHKVNILTKTVDFTKCINKLNKSINLPYYESMNSIPKILTNDVAYYNRFKIANPNVKFTKGFPHVFFVSPMCNILGAPSSSGALKLNDQFKNIDLYNYVLKTSPEVLGEISRQNTKNTDFSMLLSNYVKSFSLSDEYISTDTYGRTFTGNKIAYGKNDIESKVAGSFEVTFSDTRNLDIYKLHRIWVDYISGVYRGTYSPRNEDIMQKVLDYTGALYYILTAEDGETIVFWSKYYGIFPSTVPSSQYSWGEGNVVTTTDLSISYQYSKKIDYNPFHLTEFNYNARVNAAGLNSYLPIYDHKLATIGNTYVRYPFITLEKCDDGLKHYKLRFQK